MKRSLTTRIVQTSLGTLLFATIATPTLLAPAFSNQPAIAQEATSSRKRIAIMDFNYANTSNTGYWYSYRGFGAARGISEMLINELVNDGTYIVVDRSRLEQAMTDHNMSGDLDTADAVKLGKELGVDYVVVGSVTQFNVETKRSGGRILGVRAGSEKTQAVVQINSRLIETATGDILATAKGEGEADQNDANASFRGIGGSSSSNNEDALLSAAVEQAVMQMVGEMAKVADRL